MQKQREDRRADIHAEMELLEYLQICIGATYLSDLHTEVYRRAALREFLRIPQVQYPDAAWCDAAEYLTGSKAPPVNATQAFQMVEEALKTF